MSNTIEGAQRVEVTMKEHATPTKMAEIQGVTIAHEGNSFIIQGNVDIYPAVGSKIIISVVRQLAKVLEVPHDLLESVTADGKVVWESHEKLT